MPFWAECMHSLLPPFAAFRSHTCTIADIGEGGETSAVWHGTQRASVCTCTIHTEIIEWMRHRGLRSVVRARRTSGRRTFVSSALPMPPLLLLLLLLPLPSNALRSFFLFFHIFIGCNIYHIYLCSVECVSVSLCRFASFSCKYVCGMLEAPTADYLHA